MPTFSPLSLSIVICGAVAIAGILIASRRRISIFAGYESLMQDLRRLRRRLHGELERDGADVIVRGAVRHWPVLLRFSHAENTPGLVVRMEMPATFSLFLSSPDRPGGDGRFAVRLGDGVLDSRFHVRTDHPTEARLFAASGKTRALLRQLGHSRRVSISITPGVLELTVPTIPERFMARTVSDQLHALAQLAAAMREMPGADNIRVRQVRRRYSVAARAAMIVGVVTAVATVVSATHDNQPHPVAAPTANQPPAGMDAADAAQIPSLKSWHLATAVDFEPAMIDWLALNNQKPLGAFDGNFFGANDDTVYVLARDNRSFRVVLVGKQGVKYDATYAALAAVARLPHRDFSLVTWQTPPEGEPEGDGLVLVLGRGDLASAVILFSHGGRVTSAAPADYRLLDLK
jgi:hypothetical protein